MHVTVHYLELSCTLYFTIFIFNVMHYSGLYAVPFTLCMHITVSYFCGMREFGVSKHTVYTVSFMENE